MSNIDLVVKDKKLDLVYVPVTVELYCVIGASVVISGYPTVT